LLKRCIFVDIFKFDPKFLENEEKYKSIKAEILDEDSDEAEDGSEDEEDEDEDEDEDGTYLVPFFVHAFS
jgi:pre-mRNA-splicing factor CWC22